VDRGGRRSPDGATPVLTVGGSRGARGVLRTPDLETRTRSRDPIKRSFTMRFVEIRQDEYVVNVWFPDPDLCFFENRNRDRYRCRDRTRDSLFSGGERGTGRVFFVPSDGPRDGLLGVGRFPGKGGRVCRNRRTERIGISGTGTVAGMRATLRRARESPAGMRKGPSRGLRRPAAVMPRGTDPPGRRRRKMLAGRRAGSLWRLISVFWT